ncbi:sigma-70 family RNA polymerase sigma factor [Sesbania bispinosa]|nr:sigma-70 family RNA polymerase sigma factor [Sesbania bispinosa]
MVAQRRKEEERPGQRREATEVTDLFVDAGKTTMAWWSSTAARGHGLTGKGGREDDSGTVASRLWLRIAGAETAAGLVRFHWRHSRGLIVDGR